MDWIQNNRPICLEFKAQLKEQRTKDKINHNKGGAKRKNEEFCTARFVVAVQCADAPRPFLFAFP